MTEWVLEEASLGSMKMGLAILQDALSVSMPIRLCHQGVMIEVPGHHEVKIHWDDTPVRPERSRSRAMWLPKTLSQR